MKKTSQGRYPRTTEEPSTKGNIDTLLLLAVSALIGIGIIMVYSASGATALEKYHYVIRQALFALCGYTAIFVFMYVPIHILRNMHYFILAFSFILLISVFTPLGLTINGARRWLHLGSISIQPMEFCRIALVFYLAYFIGTKQDYIQSFTKGLLPPFCVSFMLSVLLILQPDFGSAVVFIVLLFAMYFMGGGNKLYVLGIFLLSGLLGTMLVAFSEYRLKRVLSFLDPFKDATNTGYQVVQSLYAIASGGITGLGLGEGRQKLYYLPEAHNDFIFAVFAEELGFLGVTLLFVLYGLIFFRAYKIIMQQTVLQDKLLVFGVTFVLCFSTLFNIGVVVGFLPPKGIALPFLSYGGSSLIASCLCIGILLRFSMVSKAE